MSEICVQQQADREGWGRGTVRVVVTMMDQINGHFHSDSVSNINTIVYHSRAAPATFISISFRGVEDHRFQTRFIREDGKVPFERYKLISPK